MMESKIKELNMKVGKHIRSLQRNYPYPIKGLIKKAPPIQTYKDAIPLVIVAQNKTFIESLWTAYTWLHYSNTPLSPTILINGEFNHSQKDLFLKIFPSGNLDLIDNHIDSGILADKYLKSFCESHRFGKILALKLSIQKRSDVIFSDPDVLVFSKPTELLEKVSLRQACFFSELNASSISQWVRDKTVELSLKLTGDFNSGVLFMPRNSFSIETCCKILEGWSPKIKDYFPEQTICDVLITQSGGIGLPVKGYVVNNAGMWYWQKDTSYEEIKIRHFVGNVRHRMYMSGYPRIRDSIFINH